MRKKSLLSFFFFFFFLSFAITALSASNIDILVFSPHPDDAVLCCGGTIAKALKTKKKVKVVFVTNGDAYSRAAAYLAKKKEKKLLPADYINLGIILQKEALRAQRKLGLKKKDIISLSYPDKGRGLFGKRRVKGTIIQQLLTGHFLLTAGLITGQKKVIIREIYFWILRKF